MLIFLRHNKALEIAKGTKRKIKILFEECYNYLNSLPTKIIPGTEIKNTLNQNSKISTEKEKTRYMKHKVKFHKLIKNYASPILQEICKTGFIFEKSTRENKKLL